MSHADAFERHAEREEDRISQAEADGEISREEARQATRDLQDEGREAYETDQQDALDRVRDDWGI